MYRNHAHMSALCLDRTSGSHICQPCAWIAHLDRLSLTAEEHSNAGTMDSVWIRRIMLVPIEVCVAGFITDIYYRYGLLK